MSDTRYIIRHADGDIVLDGATSAYPETVPGETVTFEFVIGARPYNEPLTVSTGGTAGGPAGFTAGGVAGATVSQLAPFQPAAQSYRRLIDFAAYAGTDIAGTAEFGVPFFREQIPADAPVATNLVQIEPGAGVTAAPALWGLIRSVDDQSRRGGQYRVSVEVFVLGDTAQHPTETDLRAALEDTVS